MATTLFLSDVIDLITVDGHEYELSTFCELTGLTEDEIKSTVLPENIEYYTSYDPHPDPMWENDLIEEYDAEQARINELNGDLPF